MPLDSFGKLRLFNNLRTFGSLRPPANFGEPFGLQAACNRTHFKSGAGGHWDRIETGQKWEGLTALWENAELKERKEMTKRNPVLIPLLIALGCLGLLYGLLGFGVLPPPSMATKSAISIATLLCTLAVFVITRREAKKLRPPHDKRR